MCLIRYGEEGVKIQWFIFPINLSQHKTFMITPWFPGDLGGLVLLVPVVCTILEGWFTAE